VYSLVLSHTVRHIVITHTAISERLIKRINSFKNAGTVGDFSPLCSYSNILACLVPRRPWQCTPQTLCSKTSTLHSWISQQLHCFLDYVPVTVDL